MISLYAHKGCLKPALSVLDFFSGKKNIRGCFITFFRNHMKSPVKPLFSFFPFDYLKEQEGSKGDTNSKQDFFCFHVIRSLK